MVSTFNQTDNDVMDNGSWAGTPIHDVIDPSETDGSM
jgi:hypothetical protein